MKFFKYIILFLVITLIMNIVILSSYKNKYEVDVKYVYAGREIIANDDWIVVPDESKSVETEKEVEETSDVLETQVGKMSGYGPDCVGCSGYLAAGGYVGNGNIYYDDPTYGKVRIVAGDRGYPFGTIVRVKNSYLKDDFLVIVLDRGGAIGFNKKALFDLLYPSEYLANLDGVSYNTTFEILRYGY